MLFINLTFEEKILQILFYLLEVFRFILAFFIVYFLIVMPYKFDYFLINKINNNEILIKLNNLNNLNNINLFSENLFLN